MDAVLCDKCKKPALILHFTTGETRPDIASGRSESIEERIDLCQDCIVKLFMRVRKMVNNEHLYNEVLRFLTGV